MNYKYFLLTVVFSLFFTFQSWSQDIEIVKIEIRSEQIFINYAIDDQNPNNEYLVTLYSSADNFSAPLTNITGDVGQEVKPGMRTAIWNIVDDLGQYEGALSIEVRAIVFIPFIRLQNFTEGKYKRGKPYDLKWRPGNTNPIHIELYRKGTRLQGELNHPNNGSYTINFSSEVKTGTNYQIKLTDSKHPEEFVFTTDFKIKRKIPILIIALPVAAGLGYLAYSLLSGGVNNANNLPDFPTAPSGN